MTKPRAEGEDDDPIFRVDLDLLFIEGQVRPFSPVSGGKWTFTPTTGFSVTSFCSMASSYKEESSDRTRLTVLPLIPRRTRAGDLVAPG